MLIALDDGTAIRGDLVLRAVQRFDLTPIPSTLEATIRADDTLTTSLVYGAILIAGLFSDRYRIIKVRRAILDYTQQREGLTTVMEITAVLEAFAPLAFPLARAVVKEGKSFGEVYRSCRATALVSDDIPVPRFSCLAGRFPTVQIARVLQEEAAAVVWTAAGKVAFKRLSDLFTAEPVERLAADQTQVVESDFLEQHAIPWALSTDAAGGIVKGNTEDPREFVYLPRTSARVLANMTRCMVVRRTLTRGYSGTTRAGDGIDVAGVRHVVVTAAHSWANGGDSQAPEQVSRLWLAQMQST